MKINFEKICFALGTTARLGTSVLKKNGKSWEFSQVGDPPQVGNPMFVREKKISLFCILGPHKHFWFSQKCYFLGGIMVNRSGNG